MFDRSNSTTRAAPDLQLRIRRCGTRDARSVGEEGDPKRNGGYQHIYSERWRRRDELIGGKKGAPGRLDVR